jgi:hypothetical protein
MINQFPHTFETESGHLVTVNREKDHYTFTGTSNLGEKIDFRFFEETYSGDGSRGRLTGNRMDQVEVEVLEAFGHLQR